MALRSHWLLNLYNVYYALAEGWLDMITVFLSGSWVGAEVKVDGKGQALRIAREQAQIRLPLPSGD